MRGRHRSESERLDGEERLYEALEDLRCSQLATALGVPTAEWDVLLVQATTLANQARMAAVVDGVADSTRFDWESVAGEIPPAYKDLRNPDKR